MLAALHQTVAASGVQARSTGETAKHVRVCMLGHGTRQVNLIDKTFDNISYQQKFFMWPCTWVGLPFIRATSYFLWPGGPPNKIVARIPIDFLVGIYYVTFLSISLGVL